jgi:hypothetical protein
MFSKDGKEWTAPARVLTEGEWLWRVTWHGGKAYGITYDALERASPAAQEAAKTGKAAPGPADWKLKLIASADGLQWDLITHLDVPGHPNETTLRFLSDGEMVALVRREGGSQNGWIGAAKRLTKNGNGRKRSIVSAVRISSNSPMARCGPPAAFILAAPRPPSRG